MRVIGGAGGPNITKFHGVKSGDTYRTQHAEKAMAKIKWFKEQQRRDKAVGIHDAKVQARKDLKDAKLKAEESFIAEVSEAMGWDVAPLQKEIEGLTAEPQKKRRQPFTAIAKVGFDPIERSRRRMRTPRSRYFPTIRKLAKIQKITATNRVVRNRIW